MCRAADLFVHFVRLIDSVCSNLQDPANSFRKRESNWYVAPTIFFTGNSNRRYEAGSAFKMCYYICAQLKTCICFLSPIRQQVIK
jgi:hypothetical protein